MAKKELTNDQMLRNLIKDLDGIESALLRERIVKIGEITRTAIKADPDAFANPIVHPSMYENLFDKVDKHLGFKDDKH